MANGIEPLETKRSKSNKPNRRYSKESKNAIDIYKSLKRRYKNIEIKDLFNQMKIFMDDRKEKKKLNETTAESLDDDLIENFRELPISLEEKRILLEKIRIRRVSSQLSQKNSQTVCCLNTNYRSKRFFANVKDGLARFGLILVSPLKSPITSVQRHYGRGLASFFHFVKWLIVANIIVSTFVLIPFLGITHSVILSNDAASNANYTFCTGVSSMKKFDAIDVLIANNSFKLVMYGCFSDQSHSFYSASKAYYNMQYAYLLTILVFFIYWLFKTASSLVKVIKKNLIEANVVLNKTFFVNILFSYWDFSLRNKDAVNAKRNEIYRGLTVILPLLLFELVAGLKLMALFSKDYLYYLKNRSKTKKESKVLRLFLTNILYLALASGIGVGVYFFIYGKELESFDFTYKHIVVGAFIVGINYIIPIICDVFAYIEGLSDKSTETILKLFRMFLVQLILMGFIFAGSVMSYNKTECYETKLGQLFYTLTIMDFLFTFFDCLIVLLKRFLIDRIVRRIKPEYYREFDIAYYTLNAINSQALIWIGTYYSPFLTVFQILKLIVSFFLQYFLVWSCYKPSRQPWSATKNRTFFLFISLVEFMGISGAIGYLNVSFDSSKTCGPFRDTKYSSPYMYIYKLRDEIVGTSTSLSTIVSIITSPGVVGFIFFCLVVGVYTILIVMYGHKQTLSVLKLMHADQKIRRNNLKLKKKFFIEKLKSMNVDSPDGFLDSDQENDDLYESDEQDLRVMSAKIIDEFDEYLENEEHRVSNSESYETERLPKKTSKISDLSENNYKNVQKRKHRHRNRIANAPRMSTDNEIADDPVRDMYEQAAQHPVKFAESKF